MSEENSQNQKSILIDDLLATETVIEEIWRYHPDNPNRKDIVKEYKILNQILSDIKDKLSQISESE
tara:strand:+ start:714 stop:911 length:198 start_codon:yes stop_codon:yes gene_type:complete